MLFRRRRCLLLVVQVGAAILQEPLVELTLPQDSLCFAVDDGHHLGIGRGHLELENGSLLGLALNALQLFKVLSLQSIELFKLLSLAVYELLGELAAPGLEEGEVLLVAFC